MPMLKTCLAAEVEAEVYYTHSPAETDPPCDASIDITSVDIVGLKATAKQSPEDFDMLPVLSDDTIDDLKVQCSEHFATLDEEDFE